MKAASPHITTFGLILTCHTMMTLLYIAVYAGAVVIRMAGPEDAGEGGPGYWMNAGLHLVVAVAALVAAVGLYAAPKGCGLLALASAGLFLWRGLFGFYDAASGPGADLARAGHVAGFYVVPALLVLLSLPPILKIWLQRG